MNQNNKSVMPEITRETYKTLKHYDRQQMASFCERLYMNGYHDGRASVPGVDVERLYEAIAAVKGIGPKKLAEIKTQIDEIFGETEKSKKPTSAEKE